MGYNYEVLDQSDLITVIIEVFEDKGEIIYQEEDIKVRGNNPEDLRGFQDQLDAEGIKYMFFGDEEPEVGRYQFVGRLRAYRTWTDMGWEYDCGFDLEEWKKLR